MKFDSHHNDTERFREYIRVDTSFNLLQTNSTCAIKQTKRVVWFLMTTNKSDSNF